MLKWLTNIFPLVAVCAVFFALAEWHSGWKISSDVYWRLFGLTGASTAYDYLSAPGGTKFHFYQHLCDDGVCLDRVDWECGFTIASPKFEHPKFLNTREAIQSCFSDVVTKVPVYIWLDEIRKMCGRAYMVFDPESQWMTAEKCKSLGGQWAVKGKAWEREKIYLENLGFVP